MSEITDFYRRLSPTSDPGRHKELVLGFPADAEALGTIVRGLLIHNFEVKVRGLPLPAERMSHMQAVGAEAILDNVIGLDPGPLGIKRRRARRRSRHYRSALTFIPSCSRQRTPSRVRPQWGDGQ